MSDTLEIIIYSSLAGVPIFIGGLISSFFQRKNFKLKSEINHWIVAFGGGALVSAVSFVLVPKALDKLELLTIGILFLGGTFTFMMIDMLIARIGGSFAQVLSMMMDFIPEALALGASFAHSNSLGLLLAIFIGLQNLPEGFNSYIELKKSIGRKSTLLLMFGLSFAGIFAALAGEYFLSNYENVIAGIMLFAGGGILYLIFQDIAPMSKRSKDWIPATGASIGFFIGIVGVKLIG